VSGADLRLRPAHPADGGYVVTSGPKIVHVTCCPDGPFLVRGADVIRDEDGVDHATQRPVVAVCRCGKSTRKPWCDGMHKLLPKTAPTPRDSAAE